MEKGNTTKKGPIQINPQTLRGDSGRGEPGWLPVPTGRRPAAPPAVGGPLPGGCGPAAQPAPGSTRMAPLRPGPPLTLLLTGPGMRSFSACLFSSARRALQCSHQTPRSEPGEEPPPLPEPGEPVPKPGEPPNEPGELVPMPGEAGPGEPVKEPGEEVPEPGDGVPEEPRAEPAPSGAGRLPARDSSYAFRYQLSGEKGAAGLVGEQGSVTWSGRRSSGSGRDARRRRQVSLGRSAPAAAPAPRPPPRGAQSRRAAPPRPSPGKLNGAGGAIASGAGNRRARGAGAPARRQRSALRAAPPPTTYPVFSAARRDGNPLLISSH